MNAHQPATLSILIMGAGMSGSLLAAQLLAQTTSEIRITLIEKTRADGPAAFLASDNREHVLNSPAKELSAFQKDPDHFYNWWRQIDETATPESFPPRSSYGQYLAHLLSILDTSEKHKRLTIVQATATHVTETDHGVEVQLDNGSSILGHLGVLAVDRQEHRLQEQGVAVCAGGPGDTPLDPFARVMVLGSGLNMVDAWLTLASRRHKGPILVVSRQGLLPRRHKPVDPIEIDAADIPFGTSMHYFTQWFIELVDETLAAGGDWRSVLDGLQPFNQRIWQSWSLNTRRRFLRYVRPLWNSHRHRLPPDLHDRLIQAVSDSQITLIPGTCIGVEKSENGAIATIRRRGLTQPEQLEVARIYDCGGVSVHVENSPNPLVRALVADGKARSDPLEIGLDVTGGCALVGRDGIASDRLYAVGPLTRGTFFEIDTVTEIRSQVHLLAADLLRRVTTA